MSIAPKQLLHDFISGHKHNYRFNSGVIVESAKKTFQCNWEDNVLVSPFTEAEPVHFDVPLFQPVSYNLLPCSPGFGVQIHSLCLRGPPIS